MRRLWVGLVLLIYAPPDAWSEFRRLSHAREPDRRCEAIELIRPRADLPMVQALLPLLGDPHARVRKRAAEAITRATAPECVEFLAKTGLRLPQRWVRIHTAAVLGLMHDPA